jgi:hypothetical protein
MYLISPPIIRAIRLAVVVTRAYHAVHSKASRFHSESRCITVTLER